MRLDREDVKDIKEALVCDKDRRPLSYTCCIELIETIEGLYDDVDSLMEQLNRNIFAIVNAETKIKALQQENEQLKADCDRMLGEVQELTMEYNHFKERLQISPYGDDKIDELDEALENCKFQYEQLKQENEQLQAQVARMREALIDYKTFLESFQCTCEPSNETHPGVCCERCCRLNQAKQALAEIDKALEVE